MTVAAAVLLGTFNPPATIAQDPDPTIQNSNRMSYTIPDIKAESERWANYATFRVIMKEEIDANKVKGGVLHVRYRIDCNRQEHSSMLPLGKPCPAPIHRMTTISCYGTEGGVIVVNLGQPPYSTVQKPYDLTLTNESVKFIDWNEKYILPSYCDDGKYEPSEVTKGNDWTTSPVTVN